MSYENLVRWMFNLERFGIKLGLDNMREFSGRIGNPHKDFRSIHVTGTNGKGSVCNFATNILREHGLKVGLYTSPHLVDFRERIAVNGEMIPEQDVVRLSEELRAEMEDMAREGKEKQLTFFEFTTGLAFKYFSEQDVDYVVAEVGMGGRLDATNVVEPDVAAITRIGIEHTDYLGKTMREIAYEKAGIIKPGCRVVTCEPDADTLAFFESTCTERGCELYKLGVDFHVHNLTQSLEGTGFDYRGSHEMAGLRTGLIGSFQAENAAAAIAIVEKLDRTDIELREDDIRTAVENTRWPGRLDVVSTEPLLIIDGSHNPDGVSMTVQTLRSLGTTPMTFVLACMSDKDARQIVRAMAPDAASIVTTQVDNKRAMPAEDLARIVKEEFGGPSKTVQTTSEAIEVAIAEMHGKGVCVIGSLYLAGEAIQWCRKMDRTSCELAHKV